MKENLSYYIHRISSGKLHLEHDNNQLLLVSPSLDTKYKADLIYNQIVDQNLYSDEFLSENEISFLLKKNNLWDQDSEKLQKKIEKNLENMKVDLYKNRTIANRIKNIKKDIETYKDSVNDILIKKHHFDSYSLEYYANSKKTEYIIKRCLFFANSKKRFFSKSSDNIDYLLFQNIMMEINKQNISVEIYKKVARSEQWKTLWNCNKKNIFGKNTISLTDEQKTLINISIMYDRVYEHPECPEDFVIDDDDMLEGWMIFQKRKNDEQKKENSQNSVSNIHGNAKEVFIVADRDEVEDIMSMNSLESQRIIKQRSNVIKKSEDGVNVALLPDVQQDIMQQKLQQMNRK